MSTAREPVRFNEQDDNRTQVAKLNRLVDELYTKLSAAELRLTQSFQLLKSPTADYVMTTDADGKGTWQENPETTPAGSDTQVQFNDGGDFGADSDLTYNTATDTLSLLNLVTANLDVSNNAEIAGTLDVDGLLTAKASVSVTGDVTATGELDGATLDISGSGDIDGTLDVGGLVIDGTETDELIDMSRTIDAEVTKPGVTLHESRTGIAATGSTMNGFEYKSSLNATYYAAGHNGFYSEIDHDAGTMGRSFPFFSQLTSASGNLQWGLYAGLMALDNAALAAAPPIYRAGLSLNVKGNNASHGVYGAYTQAENADKAGLACGYQGYGYNADATANTNLKAIGVFGYAESNGGIAVGLQGAPASAGAKKFGAFLTGHNWFNGGNTYLRASAAITPITDAMTDQWNEADDGNLYVEKCLEVGDCIQFGERSSDAADPSEGNAVMWMSDGTGTGADGDIMMKITAGGTTKTKTLVTF